MCPNGACSAWELGSLGPEGHLMSEMNVLRSTSIAGWKGTFVCEPDKAKALEMYKAWKAGVTYEPAHH